jgi:Di-haem oxidoreductase, putative peroxidase
MKVCKTHRLDPLVVCLIAACALLLSAVAQAQTDPGPRPVGSSDICANGALPNAKFPGAPQCIDNVQPADANGNGGAGNVVSFGSNLTGLWFAALPIFGTPATVSGPQTGGSSIPGLGPSFNATSCFQCHSQPTIGGSSPNTRTPGFPSGNPQVGDAPTAAQLAAVSSFIAANGPVREARFVKAVGASGSRDAISAGTVAELFVVDGRPDAPPSCTITQEDFATQVANGNVIFRIPIPTFGEGFVENTPDLNLIANVNASTAIANNINLFNPVLGLNGKFNHSGNDSTITRFGWKAQNKSMLMFAGEASNAEMGVDNELFPNEKTNGNGHCLPTATDFQPEDQVVVPPLVNPPAVGSGFADTRSLNSILTTFGSSGLVSDITNNIDDFAVFMRLNAAPGQCAFNSKTAVGSSGAAGPAQCFSLTCTASTPGCVNPNPSASAVASIQRGAALFGSVNPSLAGSFTSATPPLAGTPRSIGCALCHGDLLTTTTSLTPELNNASFSPFSDFALHVMDPTLADGVTQGQAGSAQFRTAPLWGIGQRLFFMHDGRANDLLTAILDHAPTAGTTTNNNCAATPNNEACQVIVLFNSLPATSTNGAASRQDLLNFLRSL